MTLAAVVLMYRINEYETKICAIPDFLILQSKTGFHIIASSLPNTVSLCFVAVYVDIRWTCWI